MDQIVQPFDLQRMLVGDQPALFYLEIIVRTSIIYIYALLLLRWLGSRTVGQLSTIEFLLVIALGSAVGDPMFYPDVPLLHAMAVVTLVVLANKGLDLLVARSRRAEGLIDGEPVRILKDGVLDHEHVSELPVGRGELFQQFRHFGVRHLGEIEQAFMEPDGRLTVFRYAPTKNVRPGLPIVPPWEVDRPPEFEAGQDAPGSPVSCTRCGTTIAPEPSAALPDCPNCGHSKWYSAAMERDEREDRDKG